METGILRLAGMRSPQCADVIAQAIRAVEGVDDIRISFDNSNATVSFDESQVSLSRLKTVVEGAGYQIAKPKHGEDGACCGGCGG